jgi:large subunit ribosomal protein L14
MINVEMIIRIADNSGALLGSCIRILKISSNSGAIPGQTITISVKKNIFKKNIIKKSKIIVKGQICKALIIRSRKGLKRWGNFFIRSSSNAIILLNRYDLPYGTRLFGVIFREVKKKMKYSKIISLADIVL